MRESRFIFFLLVSIIAHLLFFGLIVMSKSIRFIDAKPEENVVFMHVVPISQINNIKPKEQKQSDLTSQEKAKKVDSQANSQQSKKHESVKEEIKESIKEPEIVPKQEEPKTTQEKPEEPKIVEPKPEEKQPEKEKIEEKKQEEKKQKITKAAPPKPKETLDLKALAKSLSSEADLNKEKSSVGSENKSNKKSGNTSKDDETSSSSNYNEEAGESVTARALLQQKIESNWGRPPSMRDYEKLKIKVKLKLDINQNVQEIYSFEFLNEVPPLHVQAVIKESIIRAIKLSEPFEMLSLESYDDWHENSLVFSYK